jgi:D-sedoheptulose 7-phosphate isomerase
MTKTVFTNGCFDVLHPGHIDLLRRARALGDRLIVGINSDTSVRAIKGPGRPVFDQEDRRALLLGLESVDDVIVFDEQTPERLINEIAPDVLVKGGDWKADEIVGSDFVLQNGGEVVSLPLLDGYSSTRVIDSINSSTPETDQNGDDVVSASLAEHNQIFLGLANALADDIRGTGELLIETFRSGNKIVVLGNGGSAADAQHLAAEFVGRYETERISLPAIALTTDTSALTAIGNDYGFERVFARQVESLVAEGDCIVAISTSGNSPNVIAAVMEGRRRGAKVIGMTGSGGKKLASLSDASIMVPADRTARIQEAHITICHIWCEMVDAAFAPKH